MRHSFKCTVILSGIAVIALLFFSCKKDKSTDSGCTADVAHVAGTYRLTALQYQSSSSATAQNFFSMIDDCSKDDRLILNTDGSYSYRDEGVTCSPSGNAQGKWSIQNNRFRTDDADFPEGLVTTFDCKSLVYYVSDVYATGDKLIFTLTRQ